MPNDPITDDQFMNSIVVHYKELALKGQNRPWFIQMLVRNLQTALAGLDVPVDSLGDGPDRDRARAATRRGPTVRERIAARVRHRQLFVRRAAAPHDFDALAAAILDDLGDRDAGVVPRVSARRADKRFPFTSPQIEREVGGLIKEAKGWRVDLDAPGADDSHRDAARRTRSTSSARSRAPAACRPAPAGASPVCCRAASTRRSRRTDDAARLLGAADPLSQLSDPVARVAGEGARDRGAADEVSAAVAAGAGAVRRAAAAGGARRAARAARGDLPPADAAHRRAARARAGARARWSPAR